MDIITGHRNAGQPGTRLGPAGTPGKTPSGAEAPQLRHRLFPYSAMRRAPMWEGLSDELTAVGRWFVWSLWHTGFRWAKQPRSYLKSIPRDDPFRRAKPPRISQCFHCCSRLTY